MRRARRKPDCEGFAAAGVIKSDFLLGPTILALSRSREEAFVAAMTMAPSGDGRLIVTNNACDATNNGIV